MKFAVISDVHGNLEALTAVLADIEKMGVKKTFCLGDVVGYGANPLECLKLVQEKCDWVVTGNHEYSYLVEDFLKFKIEVAQSFIYVQKVLKTQEPYWKDCFLKLPYTKSLSSFGAIFTHSSLHYPEGFYYIEEPGDMASRQFKEFGEHIQICFSGHTHKPFILKEDSGFSYDFSRRLITKKVFVNVGSVGQPREKKDKRASYALCEKINAGFFVEIRRVEYDIKEAARKIIAAGLPSFFARRLEG